LYFNLNGIDARVCFDLLMSGNFMRALILLVIGLIMGAIGSMFAANTLAARHAYPRGVMAILQHHVGAMHEMTRARQCAGPPVRDSLLHLRHAADEIDPAFAGADADFGAHARKLDLALDAALAAAPADCAAVQRALVPVADACQSCHQLYR
jgi:hypothetical protein